MTGKTLSHYQITEKVGEGGMGVVFLANDLSLGRKVALKFLSQELMQDPVSRKRLLREAKAAAALDHPNICSIHEIAEAEGQDFIVMEYVEGQTLADRLRCGSMPLDEALQLASEIAEALDEAHEKHIIHRDLKPSNIMLTRKGHAKVMDFGLAKQLTAAGIDSQEATNTALTRDGSTVGTLAYMSPEQLRGESADLRSDVFSFGTVLYEMLGGTHPFKKQSGAETIGAILTARPPSLLQLRPDIPRDVDRIVNRALEKDAESRYRSAGELLRDLRLYEEGRKGTTARRFRLRTVWPLARKPRIAVAALLVLLVVGLPASWILKRQAKTRWAREELLPEIERLAEADSQSYATAYELAVQAEEYLPHDAKLAACLKKIAADVSITTEPAGANVSIKEYSARDSEWKYLGASPIDAIRLPVGVFRWKLEKDGHETVYAATRIPRVEPDAKKPSCQLFRRLDKAGTVPAGMVRVKGEKDIGDFFMDRYEVTNEQFKEFVDSGGYQQKKYWKQRFIDDGKELSWEEARKHFVDQTGQPGPAEWDAGGYPEGRADYPVSGVSWYEAAAYAEFAGKSLPTASHWGIAADRDESASRSLDRFYYSVVILNSSIGKGMAPVGRNAGMTSYGLYDMAGNVREWCLNGSPQGKVIRGGAWNDVSYLFEWMTQAPPFDRSSKNGFRCALYSNADTIPKSAFEPVQLSDVPDFFKMKPISDSVFRVYRERFLYDKTDLNGRTEWRKESSRDWIQEKITLDAAYEGERVIAYLFLPRTTPAPYQTVIYFPSTAALEERSSEGLEKYFEFDLISFLVRNGRAVLFPIYKLTFERGYDGKGRILDRRLSARQWAELRIKIVKDYQRSIDYLETRPEVDIRNLAHVGLSWGGDMGAVLPALENRLKASILYVGCLEKEWAMEENGIDFVTRVKVPTLMLNGKYDMLAAYEAKAKPMFDLLGTPKEDKVLKLYDTDHYVPRNELIKETLAWLDRYLGPVR